MAQIELENMNFLWQYIPAYDKIFGEGVSRSWEICGAGDEVRLLFAVSAVREKEKKVLYVTETEEKAKSLRIMARRFLSAGETGYYPARDRMPCESVAINGEPGIERIRAMEGLAAETPYLAFISKDALSRRVIPPFYWRNGRIELRVGDVMEISALAARLVEVGYVRESLTEERGFFSVRGSVVDIFPPSSAWPCRVDFFDDEIESIRLFDPETQVSRGEIKKAVISPGSAFFLPEKIRANGVERIRRDSAKRAAKLRDVSKRRCVERTERLLDYVAEGAYADITEQLLSYFYKEAYLEDYLPKDGMIFIEEPAAIGKAMEEDDREMREITYELYRSGETLSGYGEMFRNKAHTFAALDQHRLLIFSYIQVPTGFRTTRMNTVPLREFSFYRPVEERVEELEALCEKGPVYFCAADENGKTKLEGLVASRQLKNCRVVMFPLQKSVESYETPAFFLAEGDLGQTAKKEKQGPRRRKKSKPISSFVDLKVGDYVVHDTHGIGRYMGIERLAVDETERDYLLIRYEGTDKLYIPTDQMDLIQKYIGSEGAAAPKVNKLGGRDWKNTKEKVRASVREMAEELIRLYAARNAARGHAFSPDSEWQREMEADFPFEETPDQTEAIAAVKADMESGRPMDRLLCGDVGYGKTEVALRAAFKAVLDGKQVAILVPTTVLAQQHERTFHERLDRFGVRIGALSRFKTEEEQKAVKEGLASGLVDIVIGTHKVINADIAFKDLGLLVIDEEQRFGVGQKEKLKSLKENIDILAMSATPIPRTLHMSLVGIRDISIIETPPRYRRPVRTYVMEYQSLLLKEALSREIERGGQIYYIHNRIDDLMGVAATIKSFVPEARVLVAHGRMGERALETTMMDFMEGKGDILLCTTIVESGIDLSNVNTLIVDEADRYGLSQMYQLRGRVGRGRQQAFAYFFYPRGKLLNTPAQKRLAAIRDYTDLGSGFKIAMRDMEIRGTGNLLGSEQHGHMASVGFDMYCRLIEEEVHRLSGEPTKKPKEEVPIDILSSAYLPEDYVGDGETKLAVYKQIAEIDTAAELKRCMNELEDRFGSVPDPVYNLFLVIRLKLLVAPLGITSVSQNYHEFRVTFNGLNNVDGDDLMTLMREFGRHFEFSMGNTLEMKIITGRLTCDNALLFTIKVLAYLARYQEMKRERKRKEEKMAAQK